MSVGQEAYMAQCAWLQIAFHASHKFRSALIIVVCTVYSQ